MHAALWEAPAPTIDRAARSLLQVRSRPRAGGRLRADPGRVARRSALGNRPAACGAHTTGKARRGNLRDRQPAQSRRAADHVVARTRAACRAEPDRWQARQGVVGLCLRADVFKLRCGSCCRRMRGIAGRSWRSSWSCTRPTARSVRARCRPPRSVWRRSHRALPTRCNDAPSHAGVWICTRCWGSGDRAVAVGLECLRHVGIDCPAHPTKAEARAEYERIWSRLGSRAIEDIVDLPLMQDAESLATLDLLTVVTIPSHVY